LKETKFSHLLQQGNQFVQQRRPELAIPLLGQAVSIDPQSFDVHFWLGAAYGLAQRWQEAEELPAGQWREGVFFVTLGAIAGNLLFRTILRPIIGLILLPLVFFCPLMCLAQIVIDFFLRAAVMFLFIVTVFEYVMGMHLESTYGPSWQISLATSVIWFLLSLVGVGLVIHASFNGVSERCEKFPLSDCFSLSFASSAAAAIPSGTFGFWRSR
jgi:hypothetical protein